MGPLPPPPELTAFDAVTQLIAAALYLAIGAAGLGQAPRDERTRVFCALSVAHAVAFSIPAVAWMLGVTHPGAFNRIPLGITFVALSLGAVLMFHFSQVFPKRRPWIQGSGPQLPIAYALIGPAVFLLVRWWPVTKEAFTTQFGLVFILFGFPLLVLMGLVLPVASIVSFVRSLREHPPRTAPQVRGETPDGRPLPDARPTIFGILLSQLVGGALGLLVLAPLSKAAPESFAVTLVALTVWMFGLLTPLAYAAGVWKYRALEVGRDASAEMQAD